MCASLIICCLPRCVRFVVDVVFCVCWFVFCVCCCCCQFSWSRSIALFHGCIWRRRRRWWRRCCTNVSYDGTGQSDKNGLHELLTSAHMNMVDIGVSQSFFVHVPFICCSRSLAVN